MLAIEPPVASDLKLRRSCKSLILIHLKLRIFSGLSSFFFLLLLNNIVQPWSCMLVDRWSRASPDTGPQWVVWFFDPVHYRALRSSVVRASNLVELGESWFNSHLDHGIFSVLSGDRFFFLINFRNLKLSNRSQWHLFPSKFGQNWFILQMYLKMNLLVSVVIYNLLYIYTA